MIEIERNGRIIHMWDFIYQAFINCKGEKR